MSEVKTEGFKEFEDLLIQIGQEFGYRETTRNVLTPAVKVAMEPVLDAARNMVRTDTGRMKASLKVESRIPNNRDKLSTYIHEGDTVISMVSVKQSAASLSEEFGTEKKAAHPFLRPALESNQNQVLRRLSSLLAFRLEQYRSRKMKGK